jgi:hypothetical protein
MAGEIEMGFTIEEQSKIMRKVASRYPLLNSILTMIDNGMPYGLEGMLRIQKDCDELSNFEGAEEEFTAKLTEQRNKFRKDFEIPEIELTPEEEARFENAAKLTKFITKD